MTQDDPGAGSFSYTGRVYVRPVSRGVVLEDHPQQLHLDDLLGEGYYRAVISLTPEPAPPPAPLDRAVDVPSAPFRVPGRRHYL